jgi:4-diphosphocytidyl-2-C-methyl-D-erythritol kinase
MAPLPLYDIITLRERRDGFVSVRYSDNLKFASDNALRAGFYMTDEYKTNGADIYVEKHIPVGLGLGGSSADAAGVVRGFETLYGVKADEKKLLCLGSDVPFLYRGKAARVKGTGEIVQEIPLPALNIALLTDARLKIDTKSAFDMFDMFGGAKGNINAFLKTFQKPVNALSLAATALEGGIQRLLNLLTESGFQNAVMTGSGGGVVGYEADSVKFNQMLTNVKEKIRGDKSVEIRAFST